VIDVGINKTEKGIVGDVAFDEVSKNAKALTPCSWWSWSNDNRLFAKKYD